MSSTSSTSSSAIRLTGMASGLDTDTTIKQMMKTYQLKLDKMNQDKQIVSWKQELYRDILTDTNTFKGTYYDVIKSDSYMLSKNSYSGFKIQASSSVEGQTAGVSVTANTGAETGNYSVKVTQLAAGARLSGTAVDSAVVLDTKLSELGITNGSFQLQYTNSSGVINDAIITVSDGNTTTVGEFIDMVSKGTSGNVVMKYSELTSSFSIETLKKGSEASVSASDIFEVGATNILEKLNIGILNATGKNAIAEITNPSGDTKTVEKSSNSFTLDNINYNLLKESNIDVNTITVEADVQKPYDKIKAYIDKYNELIDKINTKISEKKQYTYLPLTDEQKVDMSEKQITNWEEKAKQGLLKSDGILQNMLSSLRGAFYESVEGAGITLSEIGLSTSADYSQRGKIIIDETKLKDALKTRGEQVSALFIKTSTTHPTFSTSLTHAEREVRSKEEGILVKVQDILQDYTRTIRDSDGKKGMLIEKAGLKGDLSEFSNLLTKDLNDRQKRIDDFLDKMEDKENKYYLQFSKLETAMNQLNSQSSWLSKQLG